MKSKILALKYPFITSFPTEANLLSIFFREEESVWILNHFILLSISGYVIDYDIARDPLVLLKNCPLLKTHGLSRTYTDKTFESFTQFAVSAINNDYYIYLNVSKKYIKEYNSEKGQHDIMIFGYDLENQCFDIADFFFGKYSYKTCSFKEMEQAYINAEDSFPFDVILLKRSNNYQPNINIQTVKILLSDYLNSTNTSRLINRTLNFKDKSIYDFGIKIYDLLIEAADRADKDALLSVRNYHILYDHKKLLFKLAKKMDREGYIYNFALLEDKFNKLIHKSLVLRNLIIKYLHINNISQDKLFTIKDKLSALKNEEIDTLNTFLYNTSDTIIPFKIDNEIHGIYAKFIKDDKCTKGAWKGLYGKNGFYIIGQSEIYPEHVKLRIHDADFFVRDDDSYDERALSAPEESTPANNLVKTPAVLYSYSNFNIELSFEIPTMTTLYLYDFERLGRNIDIYINNVKNNIILYKYNVVNFNEGLYVSFLLSGQVRIIFKTNNNFDAILSGIFFD